MRTVADVAFAVVKKVYPYAETIKIREAFRPGKSWTEFDPVEFSSKNLLKFKNEGYTDLHLEVSQPEAWQEIARPDFSIKELFRG